MKINFSLPKIILPFLKDRLDHFYLAGGTALSMFYYEHRGSYDLDFFTKEFSGAGVSKIVDQLVKDSGWRVELVAEQNKKDLLKVAVYMVHIDQEKTCKLDFVEDLVELTHPLKRVDGIDILSLDDIYLRKLYAAAGHIPSVNEAGQKVFLGGRHEAKDFYDIYCLSTITMPLSQFVLQQASPALAEGVVRWYQSYDRMEMKTGLLDLVTRTKPDHRKMEEHFKVEVGKILDNMIGE
ncbi:MAG: nucleotidyl transferase AbiEii/AbiGii toxin family protein [bacterium]|nr:nucleotidyl transferase AbiEii/AbiGii toxin family protein [bacterium]